MGCLERAEKQPKENPNLDEISDDRQDNKYFLFFLDERNYENSSIA